MNKKHPNSSYIVLQRLAEIEEVLEQMKNDLEEIKQNTAKRKRKRIPLFSKRKKEQEVVEEQMGASGGDTLDLGSLLNHPMLKSLLQNKKEIDPNQLSQILKNPMIQSMLKNFI